MIRFNERGARTPLIVPIIVPSTYPLAQKLGADWPLVDIQPVPSVGSHRTAAAALRGVRRLRGGADPLGRSRTGPTFLRSLSSNGTLAFEAARQLQREGEKVELVVLFDSWAPGYRETMSPRPRSCVCVTFRSNGYRTRIAQFRRGEIRPRRRRAPADPEASTACCHRIRRRPRPKGSGFDDTFA